jgi:hypothetical protein
MVVMVFGLVQECNRVTTRCREAQDWSDSAGAMVYDLRYSLMRVFAGHPGLSAAHWLLPRAYSKHPDNVELGWLLYRVMRSFGLRQLEETQDALLTEAFAAMLADADLWPSACFVLQHHTTPERRNGSIRQLIHRRLTAASAQELYLDSTVQAYLVNRLGLPRLWISQALAIDASYRQDDLALAAALLDAEDHSEAHRVIVDRLAPALVASNSLAQLERLLLRLDANAVEGFDVGGELLLDFIQLHRLGTGAAAGRLGTTLPLAKDAILDRMAAALPRMAARENKNRYVGAASSSHTGGGKEAQRGLLSPASFSPRRAAFVCVCVCLCVWCTCVWCTCVWCACVWCLCGSGSICVAVAGSFAARWRAGSWRWLLSSAIRCGGG